MALIRSTRYPGRWTAPSGGHPQGAFKNRTAPGALDGSYIEQDWANDWDGFFSSLLSAASITPNNTVDAVGASQYYTALQTVITTVGGNQFVTKTTVPTVKGLASNLKASATGISAVCTITVDEIVVKSATNEYTTLRNVNITPSFANATGANGMDVGAAGSQTANTWYYVHMIYNPTTLAVAGLLSLSATAPTLPSGYTQSALCSVVRTDATANKYPISFFQSSHVWHYKVAAGSNLTVNPPLAATGVSGDPVIPTYVAVSLSNFVPPIATTVLVHGYILAASANLAVSPSLSITSAQGVPLRLANGATAGSAGVATGADIMLESTNIYWATNDANGRLFVDGFTLNF